jgi:hypothetical protein
VLQASERAPTPYFSIIFISNSHLSLLGSLEARHHQPTKKQKKIKIYDL